LRACVFARFEEEEDERTVVVMVLIIPTPAMRNEKENPIAYLFKALKWF